MKAYIIGKITKKFFLRKTYFLFMKLMWESSASYSSIVQTTSGLKFWGHFLEF